MIFCLFVCFHGFCFCVQATVGAGGGGGGQSQTSAPSVNENRPQAHSTLGTSGRTHLNEEKREDICGLNMWGPHIVGGEYVGEENVEEVRIEYVGGRKMEIMKGGRRR